MCHSIPLLISQWVISVNLQKFHCPTDLLTYSLTGRVIARPQFQIFEIILTANSVAMVNRFLGPEGSTKMLLHDLPVLKDSGMHTVLIADHLHVTA